MALHRALESVGGVVAFTAQLTKTVPIADAKSGVGGSWKAANYVVQVQPIGTPPAAMTVTKGNGKVTITCAPAYTGSFDVTATRVRG